MFRTIVKGYISLMNRYLIMEKLFDVSVFVVMWVSIYCSSVLFGILLSANFNAIRQKLYGESQSKFRDGKRT